MPTLALALPLVVCAWRPLRETLAGTLSLERRRAAALSGSGTWTGLFLEISEDVIDPIRRACLDRLPDILILSFAFGASGLNGDAPDLGALFRLGFAAASTDLIAAVLTTVLFYLAVTRVEPHRARARDGSSDGEEAALPVLVSAQSVSIAGAPHDGHVDGVSFPLEYGESLAIIGGAGSGRATLARAFGLGRCLPEHAQRSGSLRYLREAVLPELDMVDRVSTVVGFSGAGPVPWVEQQPIGPQLSAQTEQTSHAAGDLLRGVGLDEPARMGASRPDALSEEERRRVQVAWALAQAPEALVIDRPGFGLNPLARVRLRALLVALPKEFGVGLLLLSDDPRDAVACSEMMMLSNGRVVEQGPSRRVLSAPRHPATAALLDSVPYPNGPLAVRTPSRSSRPRWQNGCPLAADCSQRQPACRDADVPLTPFGGGFVRCLFPLPRVERRSPRLTAIGQSET